MVEKQESFSKLEGDVTRCRKCPRLVAWREEVAREKRKACLLYTSDAADDN